MTAGDLLPIISQLDPSTPILLRRDSFWVDNDHGVIVCRQVDANWIVSQSFVKCKLPKNYDRRLSGDEVVLRFDKDLKPTIGEFPALLILPLKSANTHGV